MRIKRLGPKGATAGPGGSNRGTSGMEVRGSKWNIGTPDSWEGGGKLGVNVIAPQLSINLYIEFKQTHALFNQ